MTKQQILSLVITVGALKQIEALKADIAVLKTPVTDETL